MSDEHDFDPNDLGSLIERTLAQLARGGRPASWTTIDIEPYRVEERGEGQWAVLPPEGEPATGEEGEERLSLFADRTVAYQVAAVLTAQAALAAAEVPEPPALEGPLATEEAYTEHQKASTARLLQGLVRTPAAAELLLQAVDPAILAEAHARATGESGGPGGSAVN